MFPASRKELDAIVRRHSTAATAAAPQQQQYVARGPTAVVSSSTGSGPVVLSADELSALRSLIHNQGTLIEVERTNRDDSVRSLTRILDLKLAEVHEALRHVRLENAHMKQAVDDLEKRAWLQPSTVRGGLATSQFVGVENEFNGSGPTALSNISMNQQQHQAPLLPRVAELESAVARHQRTLDDRYSRVETLVSDTVRMEITNQVEKLRGVAHDAAKDVMDRLVESRINNISATFSTEMDRIQEVSNKSAQIIAFAEKGWNSVSVEMQKQFAQCNARIDRALEFKEKWTNFADEAMALVSRQVAAERTKIDDTVNSLRAEMSATVRRLTAEASDQQQALQAFITQRTEVLNMQAISKEDVQRIIHQHQKSVDGDIDQIRKSTSVHQKALEDVNERSVSKFQALDTALLQQQRAVEEYARVTASNQTLLSKVQGEQEDLKYRVKSASSSSSEAVSKADDVVQRIQALQSAMEEIRSDVTRHVQNLSSFLANEQKFTTLSSEVQRIKDAVQRMRGEQETSQQQMDATSQSMQKQLDAANQSLRVVQSALERDVYGKLSSLGTENAELQTNYITLSSKLGGLQQSVEKAVVQHARSTTVTGLDPSEAVKALEERIGAVQLAANESIVRSEAKVKKLIDTFESDVGGRFVEAEEEHIRNINLLKQNLDGLRTDMATQEADARNYFDHSKKGMETVEKRITQMFEGKLSDLASEFKNGLHALSFENEQKMLKKLQHMRETILQLEVPKMLQIALTEALHTEHHHPQLEEAVTSLRRLISECEGSIRQLSQSNKDVQDSVNALELRTTNSLVKMATSATAAASSSNLSNSTGAAGGASRMMKGVEDEIHHRFSLVDERLQDLEHRLTEVRNSVVAPDPPLTDNDAVRDIRAALSEEFSQKVQDVLAAHAAFEMEMRRAPIVDEKVEQVVDSLQDRLDTIEANLNKIVLETVDSLRKTGDIADAADANEIGNFSDVVMLLLTKMGACEENVLLFKQNLISTVDIIERHEQFVVSFSNSFAPELHLATQNILTLAKAVGVEEQVES